MPKPSLVLAAAVAALAASATAGAAEPAAGYTLRLEGHVPVICRATVEGGTAAAEGSHVVLGRLDEFCNNPAGYQVWVDYPPELASATLFVDGQAVALSAAGSTRISGAPTAAVAAHDLALDLPEGAGTPNLSIRVVAL